MRGRQIKALKELGLDYCDGKPGGDVGKGRL